MTMRYEVTRYLMQPTLITETPRGNSIQRADNGQFIVCDCHQVCQVTQSLYAAERVMEQMEQGYQFPYSTAFQSKAE